MNDSRGSRMRRYINDELTPQESAELEREIENDPAVRDEFKRIAQRSLLEDWNSDDETTDDETNQDHHAENAPAADEPVAEYWSTTFPAGTQPGKVLLESGQVEGTIACPATAGQQPSRLMLTAKLTASDPPTFVLSDADWPLDFQPHSMILANIDSFPREPYVYRIPSETLVNNGLSLPIDERPSDLASSDREVRIAEPQGVLHLAADDSQGLTAVPQSPPVGRDFRCQPFWPSGLLRIRTTLPTEGSSDYIWAELRGVRAGGTQVLHRTILRVVQSTGGWTILRIPQLDYAAFSEIEVSLRSLTSDDLQQFHLLPIDEIDQLLSERQCRTLLAKRVPGGWEFSAKWPSYQQALASPEHGWLLRVEPRQAGDNSWLN